MEQRVVDHVVDASSGQHQHHSQHQHSIRTAGGTSGASNSGSNSIVVPASGSQPQTVYVTIPQHSVQSVIQQPQQSVIQSTSLNSLQTVHLTKSGGVYLLKQPNNSVIQSTGGNQLQAVQVLNPEILEEHNLDPSRKRQILARRPSYKKILNDLSGEKGDNISSDSSQDDSGTTTITLGGQQYQTAGLLKVIPASSLQLGHGQSSDGLPTLAMTNSSSGGQAIVHYAASTSDGQILVPVSAGDLSALKGISVGGSSGSTAVLVSASGPTTTIHGQGENMAEGATGKREVRLMKNREAARECRAKKKEYIKCLENRVAVLENQNRTLIEELKTLKALYGLNDSKE